MDCAGGSSGGSHSSHKGKAHWKARQESGQVAAKPSNSWAELHEDWEAPDGGNSEYRPDRDPKWGGPRQACQDALRKTRMCPVMLAHGSCTRPSCSFAHSQAELKPRPDLAKTRLCTLHMRGTCPHGSSCRFAHGEHELVAPRTKSTDLSTRERRQRSSRARRPPPVADEQASAQHQQPPSTAPTHSDDGYLSDSCQEASQETELDSLPSQARRQSQQSRTSRSSTLEKGAPSKANVQERGATLMVLNIPAFLTQGALLRLFEDLSESLLAEVDFFHVPWDAYEECNHSYAIINFASTTSASAFKAHWDGRRLMKDAGGQLRIVPAVLQGLSANVKHFLSDGTPNATLDKKFQPLAREVAPRPIVSLGSLRQVSLGEHELVPRSSKPLSNGAHSSNEIPHPQSQHEATFSTTSRSQALCGGGGAFQCHGVEGAPPPTPSNWSAMQTPANMHMHAQQAAACSVPQPGPCGCWQPIPLPEPVPAFQPVMGCVPPPLPMHPLIVAPAVPQCQTGWSPVPTSVPHLAQAHVYHDFHRGHHWVQHYPKTSCTATTSSSGEAPTAEQ
mmetsp:Transcript_4202/g.7135  ORF Transcript_4202/g.7135 Transcript_4202/m.7135 type:complete len:561 (+) Transcript_4202:87-1769(+)